MLENDVTSKTRLSFLKMLSNCSKSNESEMTLQRQHDFTPGGTGEQLYLVHDQVRIAISDVEARLWFKDLPIPDPLIEQIKCHGTPSICQGKEIEWTGVEGEKTCSYCGSIRPIDLSRILDQNPDAKLIKTDLKYGWPHKFYIDVGPNRLKLYSCHLREAPEHVCSSISSKLFSKTGVLFLWHSSGVFAFHDMRIHGDTTDASPVPEVWQ